MIFWRILNKKEISPKFFKIYKNSSITLTMKLCITLSKRKKLKNEGNSIESFKLSKILKLHMWYKKMEDEGG